MALILDGSLGITTPAETVQGALTTTGNTILGDASTDTLNVGNGGLVKDASGNVGIGTASPVLKLDVSGKVKFTSVEIAVSEEYTTNLYYSGGWKYRATGYGTTIGASSGAITFNNTALSGTADAAATLSERMRIDSSGKVLIGATTSNDTTRLGVVSSTSGVNTNTSAITSTSGTRYHWTFQDGASSTERGSITTNGSATAYNTSSDYRLKENILPMTGALATVQALKPVTYTWKESGDNSQGFIAHELQSVVPDCVTGEKDAVETYTDEEGNEQTRPKYQSVDTSFLVATLTAAIQELKAIVDAQAVRIAALES